MEIKIKLKISDNTEIELTEEQSKDLYELLKKIHAEKEIIINYPIVIEKWVKDRSWCSAPIITWGTSTNGNNPLQINYSLT